jgi:hypothetical protein
MGAASRDTYTLATILGRSRRFSVAAADREISGPRANSGLSQRIMIRADSDLFGSRAWFPPASDALSSPRNRPVWGEPWGDHLKPRGAGSPNETMCAFTSNREHASRRLCPCPVHHFRRRALTAPEPGRLELGRRTASLVHFSIRTLIQREVPRIGPGGSDPGMVCRCQTSKGDAGNNPLDDDALRPPHAYGGPRQALLSDAQPSPPSGRRRGHARAELGTRSGHIGPRADPPAATTHAGAGNRKRRRPESNRCTRLCRHPKRVLMRAIPLHSATLVRVTCARFRTVRDTSRDTWRTDRAARDGRPGGRD